MHRWNSLKKSQSSEFSDLIKFRRNSEKKSLLNFFHFFRNTFPTFMPWSWFFDFSIKNSLRDWGRGNFTKIYLASLNFLQFRFFFINLLFSSSIWWKCFFLCFGGASTAMSTSSTPPLLCYVFGTRSSKNLRFSILFRSVCYTHRKAR